MRDNRSDAERAWQNHMSRWGSDGYPIQKLAKGGWLWNEAFGVNGPPKVFKTKRALFAALALFESILCDKAAGRL